MYCSAQIQANHFQRLRLDIRTLLVAYNFLFYYCLLLLILCSCLTVVKFVYDIECNWEYTKSGRFINEQSSFCAAITTVGRTTSVRKNPSPSNQWKNFVVEEVKCAYVQHKLNKNFSSADNFSIENYNDVSDDYESY